MGWTPETAQSGGLSARIVCLVAALINLSFQATPVILAQTPPIPDGRISTGTLSFDGHATVGDFTGTTTTVTGAIRGASDLAEVRGWVESPVQTLKTGDSKRDKDLNKSMESKKFPVIRFDLERIAPAGQGEERVPVILHGAMVIHGVTRQVELPGTIQIQANTARVRTDFPLNLKDYSIGGLSKMLGMLKMSENIQVHVDLVFQLKPS